VLDRLNRHDLSDEEWERLRVFLPADPPRGGRWADHWTVITESVHHRNGVRDDNRPENLELWTKPQPTGIRVSDAIAWAREILAQYTGASDTSNNAQDLP